MHRRPTFNNTVGTDIMHVVTRNHETKASMSVELHCTAQTKSIRSVFTFIVYTRGYGYSDTGSAFVIACSDRGRGQDKTVLSASTVWTQLQTRQDSFDLYGPSCQFPSFPQSSIYLTLNRCKLETGSRRDKAHRNWIKSQDIEATGILDNLMAYRLQPVLS